MAERSGRGRRGYHHGDLANALLQAARRLIAERGPLGFTMADAARAAGVSASAPYRHFPDRDALLAAVARLGFQDLAARLETARKDPTLTPLQALDGVCRAYFEFARAEPAAFAAMFDPSLPQPTDGPRGEDAVFAALLAALVAAQEAQPLDRRAPALMAANHIWMLSHGAAALFADGDRPAPAEPADLLEAGVGVYLRGLGLIE